MEMGRQLEECKRLSALLCQRNNSQIIQFIKYDDNYSDVLTRNLTGAPQRSNFLRNRFSKKPN